MILKDIATALSATVLGDESIEVARIVDPGTAADGSELALAMTPEAILALKNTRARAVVVVTGSNPPPDKFDAVIEVKRAGVAMAILTELFKQPVHPIAGIHPTAVIAPDAEIADGVSIGP